MVEKKKNKVIVILCLHFSPQNRIIHLLNGAVAVLTRGRVKDVIKVRSAEHQSNPVHDEI